MTDEDDPGASAAKSMAAIQCGDEEADKMWGVDEDDPGASAILPSTRLVFIGGNYFWGLSLLCFWGIRVGVFLGSGGIKFHQCFGILTTVAIFPLQ